MIPLADAGRGNQGREDNDPIGYKSNAAKSAKAACGIKAHAFQLHSPDINPLDLSIWNEIERRMGSG